MEEKNLNLKDAVITITASGMVASTGVDETNATRIVEVLTRVASQILSIVNQPKDIEVDAEVNAKAEESTNVEGEA